jgi:tripartite-type tricarboxylate transporter receptor subunit TctC
MRLRLAVLLSLLSAGAIGQEYPVKPIRYIVPFAPSGTGDVCARFHAQGLQERMGQPVVVENRAGANQAIGIEAAVKSAPDGYTILQGTSSGLVLNTIFMDIGGKSLTYDPVRDLAPVSMVCTAPLYLAINASHGVKTIKELVALARKRPGKLTYASNGVGSTMHLGMVLLATKMNIDLLHVPYKASTQATTDLVSGVVDMFFSGSLLLPHAKTGKLHILASGSRQRTRATPDVPTMIEAGVPDYEMASWFSILVPTGVPQPIIRRLNRETDAVLRAGFQGKVTDIELGSSTPEELAQRIASEMQTWNKVLRSAGIKPEG